MLDAFEVLLYQDLAEFRCHDLECVLELVKGLDFDINKLSFARGVRFQYDRKDRLGPPPRPENVFFAEDGVLGGGKVPLPEKSAGDLLLCQAAPRQQGVEGRPATS